MRRSLCPIFEGSLSGLSSLWSEMTCWQSHRLGGSCCDGAPSPLLPPVLTCLHSLQRNVASNLQCSMSSVLCACLREKTSSSSSQMTQKRIHREIADLQREDMGEIRLAPSEDNILHWKASLPGPAGSPYENGVFELSIDLAPDYP